LIGALSVGPMAKSSSRRIALLVDHVESHYHQEIVAGALRAARAASVRVLVVAGGWLGRAAPSEIGRNFVYELLLEADIDGLVVLGGSLSNFCGITRFEDWLKRFTRFPVVTIGLELLGQATVRTDNEVGMYGAVTHLIERHQRRKIGFIRGPVESEEAEARYKGFRRALAEHQLEVEERLVIGAGLGRDNGMSAVAELFDKRHLTPALIDAIVGVNDDVARGVLEELKRRGLVVPEQLAVVGFDDASSARAANPPLTTVNQNVELQAYHAMRIVIEATEQGVPPKSLVLESVPVFRASCGCSVGQQNDSFELGAVPTGMARSMRLALIERRSTISSELSRTAAGRVTKSSNWEALLIDSLSKDIGLANQGEFLRALVALARRHTAAGGDIMVFHDILSTLRIRVLALCGVEPETRPRLEDLFQDARFSLAQIGVDVERSRQEMLNLRVRIITKECLALLGTGSLTAVARMLEEHLPALGIEDFIVSRFQTGRGVSAELVPVSRRTTGIWRANASAVKAKDLGLDPVLEQKETLIVEPLEFDGQPMGLAVMAWGAHTPEHYEQLREILSAALQAALLQDERLRSIGVGDVAVDKP
jgi:DNA-binding LacI/PurR family transcriptional regulator